MSQPYEIFRTFSGRNFTQRNLATTVVTEIPAVDNLNSELDVFTSFGDRGPGASVGQGNLGSPAGLSLLDNLQEIFSVSLTLNQTLAGDRWMAMTDPQSLPSNARQVGEEVRIRISNRVINLVVPRRVLRFRTSTVRDATGALRQVSSITGANVVFSKEDVITLLQGGGSLVVPDSVGVF